MARWITPVRDVLSGERQRGDRNRLDAIQRHGGRLVQKLERRPFSEWTVMTGGIQGFRRLSRLQSRPRSRSLSNRTKMTTVPCVTPGSAVSSTELSNPLRKSRADGPDLNRGWRFCRRGRDLLIRPAFWPALLPCCRTARRAASAEVFDEHDVAQGTVKLRVKQSPAIA